MKKTTLQQLIEKRKYSSNYKIDFLINEIEFQKSLKNKQRIAELEETLYLTYKNKL
jgi:hypothetical protein